MTLKAAYLSFEAAPFNLSRIYAPIFMQWATTMGPRKWGLVFWLSSFLIQELHTRTSDPTKSHNPEWQKRSTWQTEQLIASWPSRLYPNIVTDILQVFLELLAWCAWDPQLNWEPWRGKKICCFWNVKGRIASTPWAMKYGSNQSTYRQWPGQPKRSGEPCWSFQVFIIVKISLVIYYPSQHLF